MSCTCTGKSISFAKPSYLAAKITMPSMYSFIMGQIIYVIKIQLMSADGENVYSGKDFVTVYYQLLKTMCLIKSIIPLCLYITVSCA